MTRPRALAAVLSVITAVTLITTAMVAPGSARTTTTRPTTPPTSIAPTTTTWAPLPAFDASVAWADCGNGFECGTLTVPVELAQAVDRHRSRSR